MYKSFILLILLIIVTASAYASETMKGPGEKKSPDKKCCDTCEEHSQMPQCDLSRNNSNEKEAPDNETVVRPSSSVSPQ